MNFEHLSILDKHLSFLHTTISTKNQIFLVGGCVRDLLLNIETDPNDIDLTLAGNPSEIHNQISFGDLSHFATEKFGTITIIKEEKKYELTPLRTEGNYEDFRHPGEIQRSNDITLDAQRRDFSINCIYYTHHEGATITPPNEMRSKHTLEEVLQKHGIAFLPEQNILILQHIPHIQQLFAEGRFQMSYFGYIKNILTEHMILSPSEQKEQKSDLLRIIIDPYEGIQDLITKKIRAVGEPDKRFQEDALRVIRALRFASVLNEKLANSPTLFDFEKKTWTSLKHNQHLVAHIAKERIREELIKSFGQGNPFCFVALADEVGLLPFLFPALALTKFVPQPIRYHPFDVYTHTILTLFELQKISKKYTLRFAMLYHDVGKVNQFAEYGDHLSKEQIRDILKGPLNHRKSSPEIAKKDFQALGFSKKEIEEICRYIANHHKVEELVDGTNPLAIRKKIRSFLSEAGLERALDIFDITMGDRRGQYNPLQNNTDMTEVEQARAILLELHSQEGQFTMKQLAITGDDLMKHFSIEAGPHIGEMLKFAFTWVLHNTKERNNKRKIFHYLASQRKI